MITERLSRYRRPSFQLLHQVYIAVLQVHPHGDYVEIAMYHIHSSVHVRRQGPYLSVSVLVPKTLQARSLNELWPNMAKSGPSKMLLLVL